MENWDKKYPLLTRNWFEKRAETVIGRNTGVYDGIPYGGFLYTGWMPRNSGLCRRQIHQYNSRNRYAGTYVGRFEAYPELGCTGGPYKVWRIWGFWKDVFYALGNDKTLKFIEDNSPNWLMFFRQIHSYRWRQMPKTSWKKNVRNVRLASHH